ncbi:MAG: DUF4124 domain-containing protein [Gammaproteobacteria bacterium]|nr:DUF4124 domain-containing protein [Gammaproteobacteria bacterium]
MRYILFLIIILFCGVSDAQVFRCVDGTGKTSFSDSECKGGDNHVDIVEQEINVVPFKDKVDLEENKLKVIYSGSTTGRNSRFLRVSIYEETESYMIFFVEAYYDGPSNGRAEFRVMPNIHWGAHSYSTSEKGVSSGYARVGMGSKEQETATSDIITLQLWYYSHNNKASVIETKVVPYKKTWVNDN